MFFPESAGGPFALAIDCAVDAIYFVEIGRVASLGKFFIEA